MPAKVTNPRYAGASPEDVARALLRRTATGGESVVGRKVAVEKPAPHKPRRNRRQLGDGV